MSYVLQETQGSQKGWYAHSDGLVCRKLKHAKVFKTMIEVEIFRAKHTWWTSTYKAIAITNKELFKARLANQ